MERELWKILYHLAVSLDRRRGVLERWTDAEIVAVYLWAVLNDRPVLWACQARNWPGGLWPKARLPSQSTMSRRLRTAEVLSLLDQMAQYLQRFWPRMGWVRIVDSKPLVLGSHSKDPDSAWGRAGKAYARGYKIVAIYGQSPLPEAWDVVPLNQADSETTLGLLPRIARGGYLVGDCQLDSNPLYDACWEKGCQLVAKRKRPKGGLGHRRHSPARLRSIGLLQTEFGKALYAVRGEIERQFAWLTNHGGGLMPLPNWVRRQERVRLWVQAKLMVHAVYVYHSRDRPALIAGGKAA